ncbi:class I SAM-dependent methyltransferase [Phenylobacterium sp.]|uniref:class I SAM-dependent methyltransferase n=1 Tax=Phenylobacterium sp. TaxID=1871053 RepID=UPI00356602BA
MRSWPKHPIDQFYGIETSQKVLRSFLRTGDKEADAGNNGYAGSQPSIIRRALQALPPLNKAVFIDLGCGKGRVLAVATEFDFGEVIGIELSPTLCRSAQRNADRLAAGRPERTAIQVVLGDATRPKFPASGDVVLFLYNPFREPLVASLVKYLEQEIGDAREGSVFVVYYNPAGVAQFDASARFVRYFAERMDFAPDEPMNFDNNFDSVVIWQARGRNMAAPLPGADRWVEVRVPDSAAVVRDEPQPAHAAG